VQSLASFAVVFERVLSSGTWIICQDFHSLSFPLPTL